MNALERIMELASLGDVSVQCGLAEMYEAGKIRQHGKYRNIFRAYMWYVIAGETTKANNIKSQLTATELQESEKLLEAIRNFEQMWHSLIS